MTRPRRFRAPQHRTAAVLGTVLFLVLVASGAAHAVWTTAAMQATGSVTSARVTIGQSGFDQLKFDYSSTALVATKPITITNGSVPSAYTLTLNATTSSPAALAGVITVMTWPVAAIANCTSTTALPGTQTVKSWATETKVGGSLAATESIVYCVRTSISSTNAAAYSGGQVTARLDLNAVVGTNWKATPVTVTVAQNVTDTTPPTAPTGLTSSATTDAATTLSWTAATDNVGIASYRVYRDNTLIRSGVTGTTFTDTGLSVGTTYSYTVEALDAAGHVSPRSAAASVSTNPIPSATSWYRVQNGGLCLTGSTTANAPVTMQACGNAVDTQLWQYDQITQNNQNAFLISKASSSLVLQRDSNSSAVVATRTASANQQWSSPAQTGGAYEFRVTPSSSKTECLQATAVGTPLKTQLCTAAATQQFTLTVAN